MRSAITHAFVEAMPEHLEDGVVYVCIQYQIVMHMCCCGCGTEVVSPLHPQQWSIEFDGDSISLSPSIGNWSFPCQSHYWIRKNKVRWASQFDAKRIAELRNRDRKLLESSYNPPIRESDDQFPDRTDFPTTWVTRIKAWFKRGSIRSPR